MAHRPLSPAHGHGDPLECLLSLPGGNWEPLSPSGDQSIHPERYREGHWRRRAPRPGGPRATMPLPWRATVSVSGILACVPDQLPMCPSDPQTAAPAFLCSEQPTPVVTAQLPRSVALRFLGPSRSTERLPG